MRVNTYITGRERDMKKSDMAKEIKRILDQEILNIPNDHYLEYDRQQDYAEYLLNKIIDLGMHPLLGWEPET